MIVVACASCGFGKIAREGVARTKCAHCGRSIDLRKAVRHYEGGDVQAAKSALFIINAGMRPGGFEKSVPTRRRTVHPAPAKGRRQERKTMQLFLAEHDCFSIETVAAYLDIGREEAESKVRKLLDSGVIFSPALGLYRVVG